MEINRCLIEELSKSNKPNRIKQEFFDVIELNGFKQWFQGINPMTNRKIKIGGRTHIDVGFELGFEKSHSNAGFEQCYLVYKEIMGMTKEEIEFYKNTTSELIKKWESECIPIDEYNNKIYKINKDINNLKKWDDYVLFNEKKYGVPRVNDNGIHMENDCRGTIKYEYEQCTCHSCEDWGGKNCTQGSITSYKCDKCNEYVSHLNILFKKGFKKF